MPKAGRTIVIVGGTGGVGRELAQRCVNQGCSVVVTGRDPERATHIAQELGPRARGVSFDLAEPHTVAAALQGIEAVDHIVLAGVERDRNTIRAYDIERALRLTTLKLVGYNSVISALLSKIPSRVDSSIVLFGGLAKERPYPGSTTVSTINAGLIGLMHTLALELAPIRVNSIHPGIIGDSPYWVNNESLIDHVTSKTPTGRLARTEDVVQAALFLMDNLGVNDVDLFVDGGMRATPM